MHIFTRNALVNSSDTNFSIMIKYQNNDVKKLEMYPVMTFPVLFGAIGSGMAFVVILCLFCFLCCHGLEKCWIKKSNRIED